VKEEEMTPPKGGDSAVKCKADKPSPTAETQRYQKSDPKRWIGSASNEKRNF
jgi:hypothetical protein